MIVAVAGGKGGVGKSTVALSLGGLLDGVVVDADLGMADLPQGRGPDLHDVLAGRATPDEAIRRVGSVDLLPCGRTIAGASAADPTRIVDVLTSIDTRYGPVVVDCPAGLSADVGLPFAAADRCVLVTVPDRLSLPDAIRTRALARVLDADVERVVLNRVGDDPPVERVRQTFGTPVSTIPESKAIGRAMAAGHPVTAVAPDSAAADRFRQLAGAISSGSVGRGAVSGGPGADDGSEVDRGRRPGRGGRHRSSSDPRRRDGKR